jgi:hypothetical protein
MIKGNPAHLGHVHVEHNKVGRIFLNGAQPVFAVIGFGDAVAFLGKEVGKDVDQFGLVVDNQNLGGLLLLHGCQIPDGERRPGGQIRNLPRGHKFLCRCVLM